MWGLAQGAPKWRTRDLETGFVSAWDGEWFYHFRAGDYSKIEWVEIRCETAEQRAAVQHELGCVHVPVERTEEGFKVYEFIVPGAAIEYASV
jgi:hypothetical protein